MTTLPLEIRHPTTVSVMKKHWAEFEHQVRLAAKYIWGVSCDPENVSGVDIDGVAKARQDYHILIEMTVRKGDIKKVREDVIKLRTAKDGRQRDENIFCKCYCVFEGNVTTDMIAAGKPHGIDVVSYNNFINIFYDFSDYKTARERVAFGSAVNPHTGKKDEGKYVPVKYLTAESNQEVSVEDIVERLNDGSHIVLLGEYGSGKSRCLRQIFARMAEIANSTRTYPMAIDLRESWGLKRGTEVMHRHVDELGLDTKFHAATQRAFNSGSLVMLLDGFDELGSQAWSNDGEKLRGIRYKALEGVRDIVQRAQNGIFISGREHYFNSNNEMFTALGMNEHSTWLLRCKSEFSDTELEEFFERLDEPIDVPVWLPRRPLICQIISDLSEEDLDRIFRVGDDELEFFEHLVKTLCIRDARINASFDSETIEKVLVKLANFTRVQMSDVGPITLGDVQKAFLDVVGQMPVEEAASMLQRLTCLGRVKAESNDRQFVDAYILDGLRAKYVLDSFNSASTEYKEMISTSFINPLNVLGQRILAKKFQNPRRYLKLAQDAASSRNKTLACDVVAAIMLSDIREFDFGNMLIDDGRFSVFDMTKVTASNITIQHTSFTHLMLPPVPPPKTTIADCVAEKVSGAASSSGLPEWIQRFEADRYDSIESVSRIKQIGLAPSQELLVTVIRKTFFQKGAGRKEEALFRGLGNLMSSGERQKILNILLGEGVLNRVKGDEGWIYIPNRAHAKRMKQMLYELTTSQDDLWQQVTEH